MDFYNILESKCCRADFSAKNKEEALRKLAELACYSPKLNNWTADKIYQALNDREQQGSTGFGNELAIPHARLENVEDFLVFAVISKTGIDFNALDKKKVKIMFVILGPEDKVNEHLKILASLSRALSPLSVRKEILAAHTENVLVETLLKYLTGDESKKVERPKMKLMYIILYFDDMLYHVLEYFIQMGIEGATIVDSSGMGEYISNIPLFATFIGFMNEKKNHSKTIMAMIPENREQEIIKGIENITGDMDKKQGAMIMTLPISFYKGTMKMM